MIKKIIKIILIIIISFVAICGAFIGIYHIGLPDENPVVYGTDYIIVPETVSNEDTTIKTMSFNIRCFFTEKNKQNNWENRKDHISEVINKYSPDVVGFQEVTQPQFKYLIESMKDTYAYVGLSRSGMGLKRGDILIKSTSPANNLFNLLYCSIISEATVVFYKKSRFELLDYQTIWLSETPDKPSKGWDAGYKRISTKLELKDHFTGNEFTLINNHLDNEGETARQNSVKIINEWASEADKIIIMGDFNFEEKCDLYNSLKKDVLSDIKYLAPEEKSDNGFTYNGFGEPVFDEPIDFILVKENQVNILSYKIIKDTYGENYYISDHFPIMGEIVFK